ncbi:MAG TPA: hypothetical protein ENJ73_01930 [Desulfobacterales bacterium]|nr:hypothetical protein [Desulfobacterales bacterium]
MLRSFGLQGKLNMVLLVFVVIGLINAGMVYTVVSKQKAAARTINLAGRQRMLTQKMSKEASFLFTASTPEDRRRAAKFLRDTAELFGRTLKGLQFGDKGQHLIATKNKKIQAKLAEIAQLWEPFAQAIATLAETDPSAPAFAKAMNYIRENNLRLLKTMNEAVELYEADNDLDTILVLQAILLAVLLATAGSLWLLFRRSLVQPLANTAVSLDDNAHSIKSFAASISEAADNLADQASKQAAATEESSASLEELTSMVKLNADNTAQANNEMQNTKHVVERAYQFMEDMNKAMADIRSASEETQAIVKTIDEIAFQTNLLSLNAAVEAARAGEAGAGFAVVADEVRSLALRSAESARNTSTLIENIVQRIEGGADLVRKATDAFKEVADGAAKVAVLLDEIANANKEQAVGIDQINIGITEMDKATQQNAAMAEEAAATANDMFKAAGELTVIVKQISAMITGGSSTAGEGDAPAGSAAPPSDQSAPQQALLTQ